MSQSLYREGAITGSGLVPFRPRPGTGVGRGYGAAHHAGSKVIPFPGGDWRADSIRRFSLEIGSVVVACALINVLIVLLYSGVF